MSSSSVAVAADARLEVRAGLPNVEIVVNDGQFREVGRGFGRLELSGIPAGLYEVEARAGGLTESRLVSVKPGDSLLEQVVAWRDVPTMAPVYGGATGREEHHGAVTRGTLTVRDRPGPPAGLVVLVRTLRDRRAHPLRAGDLSLLDARLEPVAGFAASAAGWETDEVEQYALWAGRLPPGGYALRRAGEALRRAGGSPVDQSLWLPEGWTTVLVCSAGADGPRTEDASVHMLRLDETWDMMNDHLLSALEIALSGLRQGVPLVSDELMRQLLYSKFANPMLGIVGAHALRMRGSYDRDLLATVVDNLGRLVPGHPDVLALRTVVEGGQPPVGLEWPPMLTASYLDLLLPAEQADTRVLAEGSDGSVLAEGSVAERVAAYLTGTGPWLSWRASDEVGGLPRALVDPAAAAVARGSATPGAVSRVKSYLADAGRALDRTAITIADDLGVAELARRTRLPLASVSAALRTLDLAPPTDLTP